MKKQLTNSRNHQTPRNGRSLAGKTRGSIPEADSYSQRPADRTPTPTTTRILRGVPRLFKKMWFDPRPLIRAFRCSEITADDLAKRFQITPQQVRNLITGVSPTSAYLFGLCRALGVDLAQLWPVKRPADLPDADEEDAA